MQVDIKLTGVAMQISMVGSCQVCMRIVVLGYKSGSYFVVYPHQVCPQELTGVKPNIMLLCGTA